MLQETDDASTSWRLLRVLPEGVALGCAARGTTHGEPAGAAVVVAYVGRVPADYGCGVIATIRIVSAGGGGT